MLALAFKFDFRNFFFQSSVNIGFSELYAKLIRGFVEQNVIQMLRSANRCYFNCFYTLKESSKVDRHVEILQFLNVKRK
jgi:hypothetical protein